MKNKKFKIKFYLSLILFIFIQISLQLNRISFFFLKEIFNKICTLSMASLIQRIRFSGIFFPTYYDYKYYIAIINSIFLLRNLYFTFKSIFTYNFYSVLEMVFNELAKRNF